MVRRRARIDIAHFIDRHGRLLQRLAGVLYSLILSKILLMFQGDLMAAAHMGHNGYPVLFQVTGEGLRLCFENDESVASSLDLNGNVSEPTVKLELCLQRKDLC